MPSGCCYFPCVLLSIAYPKSGHPREAACCLGGAPFLQLPLHPLLSHPSVEATLVHPLRPPTRCAAGLSQTPNGHSVPIPERSWLRWILSKGVALMVLPNPCPTPGVAG